MSATGPEVQGVGRGEEKRRALSSWLWLFASSLGWKREERKKEKKERKERKKGGKGKEEGLRKTRTKKGKCQVGMRREHRRVFAS